MTISERADLTRAIDIIMGVNGDGTYGDGEFDKGMAILCKLRDRGREIDLPQPRAQTLAQALGIVEVTPDAEALLPSTADLVMTDGRIVRPFELFAIRQDGVPPQEPGE